MKQILHELIFGENDNEQPFRVRRLHASEDGNISMSALFVMLAFFVLIGFLGNAGQAVFRKLETQNAADSMALSTTTWMARHMNTLTVKNQLIGELSAIVVLAEAFGGSKEDQKEENGKESGSENSQIKIYADSEFAAAAIPPTNTAVTVSYGKIREAELKYLDFVADMATEDNGKHDVWGTIYDGRVTVKKWINYGFKLKSMLVVAEVVATVASAFVGGWPKPLFDSVALLGHIYVDLAFAELIKDWYLIEGVELFSSVLSPLHDPVFPLAIAGLSAYGDFVADPNTLRNNLRSTLDRSAAQFRVTEYQTYPLLSEIALPVNAEIQPKRFNGASPQPPRSESSSKPEPRGLMFKAKEKKIDAVLATPVSTINLAIHAYNLIPFVKNIDKIKSPSGGDVYSALSPEDGGGYGFVGNHSIDGLKEYTKSTAMDFKAESRSEWVRATHPHVDRLRRPIMSFFKKYMRTTGMENYFLHWTNRYTLSVSHRLRTTLPRGVPGSPPHLHVIKDSKPGNKGNEPWTNDSLAAERLFSFQLYARRETPNAILTPPLYPNPNKHGLFALSQSMLYNANGRLIKQDATNTTQPNTGWDLLNWTPPVRAPEWGGAEGKSANPKELFQLFTKGVPVGQNDENAFKINWQSKLVPIGPSRTATAIQSDQLKSFLTPAGANSPLLKPDMLLH